MAKRHPSPDRGLHGAAIAVASSLATILLFVIFGCRYGAPPPAGAVKVTGAVRYENAALPRGTVQFSAVEGNDSGTAKIQSDGRFVVWLQPGEYRAAVIAYDGIERVDSNGIPLPQNSIIPDHYFTTEHSGLTVSIDKDRRSVEFELRK